MTEVLLLLVGAGLVALLCWANVERKGRQRRSEDWAQKSWARMTYRGGPIDPPGQELPVEPKGRR